MAGRIFTASVFSNEGGGSLLLKNITLLLEKRAVLHDMNMLVGNQRCYENVQTARPTTFDLGGTP
jgi:hypothetical protein